MPHTPAPHSTHDPIAIAAFAAGDATGEELATATELVATCGDCAALHHDLRAIAAALPATAATAPSPRPRDFRLTADQAASIRPTGWRRLLAPLAGPRFAFAAPLGTGLATLGLAGILVAGASGMPLAGSAPQATAAGDGATAAGAEEGAPQVQKAGADASATTGQPQALEYVPASDAPASGDPAVMMPMALPQASGDPAFVTGVAGGGTEGAATGAGSAGGAQASSGTGTSGNGATDENGTGGNSATSGREAQPVAGPADQGGTDAVTPAPLPIVAIASLLVLAAGLILLVLRFAGRRSIRVG